MKSQGIARDILAANKINYVIRTNGSSMRSLGVGSIAGSRFGENPNFSCEYRIFVNKKDYDRAISLL